MSQKTGHVIKIYRKVCYLETMACRQTDLIIIRYVMVAHVLNCILMQ